MQTFLPYKNFLTSAKCLDYKRLGKQRVEAWQIYQALINPAYGWQNHPAVKMWKGHEYALLKYGMIICFEWLARGYRDTMMKKFWGEIVKYEAEDGPSWLGNREFHRSHKSNLLRKDKKFYKKYKWNVPTTLPYVWPGKDK